MTDPYQTPQTQSTSDAVIGPSPSRYGCLTAYLVFMIIANCASSVMYLIGREGIQKSLPNMPDWAFPVLMLFGIFNLVCAIALFRWRMWGFWGFVVSACVIVIVNLLIGLHPVQAASGLIGVAILYGVLQIGRENKGWSQLK